MSPEVEPGNVANTASGNVTGDLLQIGNVQGDVLYHTTRIRMAQNADIGMVLRHASGEVPIGLDAETLLYLDITNRGSDTRRLTFLVEGAPGMRCRLSSGHEDVDVVEVGAGEEISLHLFVSCLATRPMAGHAELKVLACDVAADVGDRVWWSSNAKQVQIEARPGLVAHLVPPTGRVSTTGDYEAFVRLTNTGNTELEGDLRTAGGDDDEYTWLAPGDVHVPESGFFLPFGTGSVDVAVRVTIPYPSLTGTTWRVPLAVQVHRDDFDLAPHLFLIDQLSWLSDVPLVAARVVKGFVQATKYLYGWAEKKDIRRGVLVPVLVVGWLLGYLTTPDSSTDDAASAAPPTSSAPSSTTASSSPPGPAGPTYTSMKPSCGAGTSAVLLKSITADEATAHGAWAVESEANRLTGIREELAKIGVALPEYAVRIGQREEICPAVVQKHDPNARFAVYLWIGPLAADEANALCDLIGKPADWDCIPVPAA